MILFANGCSWTWGGALEPFFEKNRVANNTKRLQLLWPHHLQKLLGANKNINLSQGCGSNQRILRTTFDWLTEQSKETLNETVAVIQWTELSRYEYLQPNNEWANCKIDICIQNYEPKSVAVKRLKSRLETWTNTEGEYSFLSQCITAARMFENFGVKYFFWTFAQPRIFENKKIFNYLNNNFNWVVNHNMPMSDERKWTYEVVSPNDKHPSVLGHKEIANIIFDEIKDRL